jgi:hypothetical protein
MDGSEDYYENIYEGEADPQEPVADESRRSGAQRVNQNQNDANREQSNGSARTDTSAAKSPPSPQRASSGIVEGCALIGPPKSGKTTLLAAIERSCEMLDKDGISLEFYPEPAIAYQIRRVINNVLGKKAEYAPTFRVDHYDFRICVTEKPQSWLSLPLEVDFRGTLRDTGGGTVFPLSEKMKEAKDASILKEAEAQSAEAHEVMRNASSIILCVDASNPNIPLLYEHMSVLLSQTRDPNAIYRRRPTFAEKMNYWIRRRPVPHSIERIRPALKAKRFLLLLTHIDQLCEAAPNPERMARLINPVVQARETLGAGLLEKIRKSLRPSAQFAVGVCSPWGFNGEEKGGKPFADENGQVLAAFHERGEELLLKWKPFGVRDAIYFIATGKCRGSVTEVTEQYLLPEAQSPAKMKVAG